MSVWPIHETTYRPRRQSWWWHRFCAAARRALWREEPCRICGADEFMSEWRRSAWRSVQSDERVDWICFTCWQSRGIRPRVNLVPTGGLIDDEAQP
jgi:hypothetical protein